MIRPGSAFRRVLQILPRLLDRYVERHRVGRRRLQPVNAMREHTSGIVRETAADCDDRHVVLARRGSNARGVLPKAVWKSTRPSPVMASEAPRIWSSSRVAATTSSTPRFRLAFVNAIRPAPMPPPAPAPDDRSRPHRSSV